MSEKITLEKVKELYKFLQGNVPAEICIKRPPRLSQRQAFDVIWYLQEHLRILPDRYERCTRCGNIYDSEESGGIRRNRCYCEHCY